MPHKAYHFISQLIGDAAHSMSSFFGQGGCQAIEDSVELVNSLYAFPNNIQGALKLYEERRGRRAQNLVAFSRWVRHNSGKPLSWLLIL